MTEEDVISARSFAQNHVKELEHRFHFFFTGSLELKKISELARYLNISIRRVDNPFIEGYIEIESTRAIIVLNKNLNAYYRKKVALHEIGHWILRSNYSELNDANSLQWKEEYANEFAMEMLRRSRKRKKKSH